jgi:hypothetical protein
MQSVLAKKKLLLATGVIALLVGVAWTQRTPVLTRYYLRELAAADEEIRGPWVDRVVSLDVAAVPGLLEQLQNKDPTVCSNAEAALVALAQRWGAEDARTWALAADIEQAFSGLSPLGQISGLQVMTAILQQPGQTTWPVAITRAAGDLLTACRDRPEPRAAALVLAGVLLDRVPPGQWLDTCRALADKGLGDRFPRARLAAVQLVMRPALQDEHELLARIAPMLRDPSPAIRRAAIVALAAARDVVSEDELLPLLHDGDIEIQSLCEAALRSRGLSDGHLELARLISDDSPRARIKVVERLGRVDDLDRSAWLRRLSQDASPAVRAAAIRAAAENLQIDFSDRLREMAQHDPSETVRQNAVHYLRQGARAQTGPASERGGER